MTGPVLRGGVAALDERDSEAFFDSVSTLPGPCV
jgi:hypothetical protein